MTVPLSPEVSAKLDRMIAARRFTVPQMAKACGTSEENVRKRRYRRNRGMGHLGHDIVPANSHNIEEAGPECPQSPPDVPATPAGVRAELNRMLDRQKAMERAFRDDGPAATPAILLILGEQRKTIEAILKAEVVFANMPSTAAQETPRQRAAEIRAYFTKLIEGAPQEVRDWVLRRMAGLAPAGTPELRHCETETPGVSGQAPENNGNCRTEAPK